MPLATLWRWIRGGRRDAPTRTLVLVPAPESGARWWHLGAIGDRTAMQIEGELIITNISEQGVFVVAARLRRPPVIGHAWVRAPDASAHGIRHVIPAGGVTNLRFDFLVQPPLQEKGRPFQADVAIIDHFGNQHWIKGLSFPYK